MTEKEITFNGLPLRYQAAGEGPLVLLVHGFAETATVWQEVAPALTGCRLILPDLPGSGASPLHPDFSMESGADALKGIIEAESGGPAIVIGHSMGGYITLALLERHPDLLRAFGLFHSTPFADSEEKRATRRKAMDLIRNGGKEAFLKGAVPKLFSPGTRQERPELADGQLEAAHNFSPDALVSYYEAMIARPDRSSLLKTTPLPVLFVLGAYDEAVPIDEGLRATHLPQLSYIHVLERSAHMGMLEEAETSRELLAQFITGTLQ